MELTFEKWEDGRWFVVLPEYDGDQEDLEMVDGADALLDYLTEDCLYVTVDVSLEETVVLSRCCSTTICLSTGLSTSALMTY